MLIKKYEDKIRKYFTGELKIYMKNKILTATLLSSMVFASIIVPINASADDTDSAIAAQDSKIKDIATKQATAQEQVDTLQKQISSLETKQAELKEESAKLAKETERLNSEIAELSEKIVKRSKALEEQARSIQTNSSSTNYVDVLLSSDSISEAITRVQAVNKIVSANKEMLEQQKEDKKAIEKKAKVAQENDAKNFENQQIITDQAASLKTKQAELETAQLDLAIEKATAEGDKQALLDKKAAAEAAVKAAAAEEAERQAQVQVAADQNSSNGNSTNTGGGNYTPSPTNPTPTTPTPTPTPGNSYPVGQCTWGAKQLAPWAGNYWGNGGQWAASAAAAGYRTGSQPQVGAIASWNDGGYGHVAVVTAVQSTTSIQVSESNYAGNMSIGNYRGWFNPTNCQGTVTYIYPS